MSDNIHIKGIPDNMIANNLFPSELIHPGEMIKDEIEFRGISQTELAREIGMQVSVVNEILKGKRDVTTKFALLLEAALGIEADLWIRLQTDYNKQKILTNETFIKKLRKIRKIASVL